MGVEHHAEPEVYRPDNYDEEELVRAAQRGQRDAFARIYETHVDRVYRYLLSRLGQPADAEDVTAEVFIRAMKALPSYKPRGTPLMAWLYRIAHNQAVNWGKTRSRRRENSLEDLAVRSSDDPEREALDRASFAEAEREMEQLTPLQRQVLSLRFAGELSIAETGKIMKRSQGAVKFLQYSALQALRRNLEQAGAGSHG
ncbi:MAG: sigma-70 family RNA polymerase sigma factor [Chloroflexi bacterium]|nr:sigma-70 family RNA polymerase sigma factor [Chloroflexota bacterium]